MIKPTLSRVEPLLYARHHDKHLPYMKTLNLLNCPMIQVSLSHFTEEETETLTGEVMGLRSDRKASIYLKK